MARRFLLWDHDSVLVDTERWYFEANRTVLRRLQIDLSEQQYLEFMAAGRSCWDLARERQLPETRIGAPRVTRSTGSSCRRNPSRSRALLISFGG